MRKDGSRAFSRMHVAWQTTAIIFPASWAETVLRELPRVGGLGPPEAGWPPGLTGRGWVGGREEDPLADRGVDCGCHVMTIGRISGRRNVRSCGRRRSGRAGRRRGA
jgi:hypothetical protein